jgi:hypothetical protein
MAGKTFLVAANLWRGQREKASGSRSARVSPLREYYRASFHLEGKRDAFSAFVSAARPTAEGIFRETRAAAMRTP